MNTKEIRRQQRLERARKRFERGPFYCVGVVAVIHGISMTVGFFLINIAPFPNTLIALRLILFLLINVSLGLIVGGAVWISLKRTFNSATDQHINIKG